MNAIAWIILTAIVFDLILNLSADALNLQQVRSDLPEAFQGWYDPEQYRKSQRYLQVNTRFGWLVAGLDLLILLVFWFAGGFAWLDQWVRGFQWPSVLNGLIYIGLLAAAKMVLGLPLSIYATFVIEENFGFNKTTWPTFVKDKIKALVLITLLGGPLLALILIFFQYAGPNAWWYCWLVTVGFMLVIQYIAPTWLMPLFNRFSPLPDGELREAITAYAQSIGFALDNIFVMDGSKRSTKSNAFFTGFGGHRRIVLFDTLIDKHSPNELVAVLAHEMGHYKLKHIVKMMVVGILQAGLMFFILSFFISYEGLFEAFYLQHVSVYAGLIFFSMLYAPLDTFLGLVTGHMSRVHEFAADAFAVTTSKLGRSLIDALKRLSVDNLANLEPHPFYVFLNYSHPPVLQRIEAIEAAASPARKG
jgi:STE24 endopeptidase